MNEERTATVPELLRVVGAVGSGCFSADALGPVAGLTAPRATLALAAAVRIGLVAEHAGELILSVSGLWFFLGPNQAKVADLLALDRAALASEESLSLTDWDRFSRSGESAQVAEVQRHACAVN